MPILGMQTGMQQLIANELSMHKKTVGVKALNTLLLSKWRILTYTEKSTGHQSYHAGMPAQEFKKLLMYTAIHTFRLLTSNVFTFMYVSAI